MSEAIFRIPEPVNEPVRAYAPGDDDRKQLKEALKKMRGEEIDIPLIIGGKEIQKGNKKPFTEPQKLDSVLAHCSQADADDAKAAVQAALDAKQAWQDFPWIDRAAVFLKAADLIATKYRYLLNAATMLGQSKSCHQAEIDAACEMIDFLRFNSYYLLKIYSEQPDSAPGLWNQLDHRPLEGFVFAITPFNFTAIAGNLPAAPALMGNTVIWKPGTTATLSGYYLMKIFQEAGLPPGVINFLPGPASVIAEPILKHRDLAGVHFTGSTEVFHKIWKTVGGNIDKYKTYPRLVGETGGKNFVFAHHEADPEELVTGLIRGAFEYQGQKCSAASRAYIPKSLWPEVKKLLIDQLGEIKVGDVTDFSNYMNAVIDESSFDNIAGFIERAKKSSDCELLFGGEYAKSEGYFVQPTVILANDPHYETMEKEIFGPVLTIHVYEDDQFESMLDTCNKTSPYALTGAIFSRNQQAINTAIGRLRHAAGNFYINDKPTGAVVGQQPFGGARASGTNDKAGSQLNLIRWVSPRTIKETFVPPTSYRYPFLDEK